MTEMKSGLRRRRRSTMGIVLEYLSLIDIHLIGNTSSLLCLCGISVSLAFYVLYLRFYPRFYNSAFLKRFIKRLLQTRAQRQASATGSSRKKRSLQHATSFALSIDTFNDEDSNNNIKTSDTDIGICCSIDGSVDSSKQGDDLVLDQYHQLPSVASATTLASPPSAAAAQMRMRQRVTRRRRTVSESPPDVIARLDDFICLIPEMSDGGRRHHHQRTRNVLDWLAQIDLDPDTSQSLFDEQEQLGEYAGSTSGRGTHVIHSLESTRSGSGQSSYSCNGWSRENLRHAECVGGDRRNSGRSEFTAIEVGQIDLSQCPSLLRPDVVMETEQVLELRSSAASVTFFGEDGDKWSMNYSSVVEVPMMDDGNEESGSEVSAKVNVSEPEPEALKKSVFYFEEAEDDDVDNVSDREGLHLQPVPFEISPPGQRHPTETPQQPKWEHHSGQIESSPIDGPHGGGGGGGGAGYDWLRMRILGMDRKRRISTGSGLSAKFLASRGLLRNHYSFTSAISGASSEYTYRESLVSKGFSVDCGEDLNDLFIGGEDLLESAEFSRYTMTNIDQLHEELEVIQRNITYINSKVEFLQSRDDLPDFNARYGYGLVESIQNDPSIMEAAAFESGMRRSRSLSVIPGKHTDSSQTLTYGEMEDVHPQPAGDGFVWDYGSDLALPSSFNHHRSLNGLAGPGGEDHTSNQLRTRRSRSDEMEFAYRRCPSSSADDLCLIMTSDDVGDDTQEVTHFAELNASHEHNENNCDEYFDDDYELLTYLHT